MRALMITVGHVDLRRRLRRRRSPAAPGRGAGIHGRHGLRRVILPAAPHDALFRARAAEGLRDRARVADILARRSDQAVSRRADRVGGGGPVAAGSIGHEQSKVLLLVHPDTAAARQSVLAVIEAYRKTFEQQSVLWENARVCVAA
jgi:Protein of unknown function (DUF3574)